MDKLDRKHLMLFSEMDDEDAFDPADYSPEELFALTQSGDKAWIEQYKAYYDDVKTGKKLRKEDW